MSEKVLLILILPNEIEAARKVYSYEEGRR